MSAATQTPTPPTQGADAPAGFDPSFLGTRAPLPTVGGRAVVELAYTHFAVQLDTMRALAVCAAVNIDGAALVDLPRADAWQVDPRVPESEQTGEAVYADNALDRGHLVRRRDPCWGDQAVAQAANVDTFHYVNAAPQVSVFNQSKDLWLGLETYVLSAAATSKARLSVLTGPVLADDDPIYRGVAIPRRFYKIAAWADEQRGGALAATGYVLDQSALLTRIGIAAPLSLRAQEQAGGLGLGAYRTYQVPIASIEEITALGFGAITTADRLGAHPSVRADGLEPAGWVELDGVESIIL